MGTQLSDTNSIVIPPPTRAKIIGAEFSVEFQYDKGADGNIRQSNTVSGVTEMTCCHWVTLGRGAVHRGDTRF